MLKVEFKIADPVQDRRVLIELNTEYMTWVWDGIERHFEVAMHEVLGMSSAEYVLTVIDKVCGNPPPQGIFYLVQVDNRMAGMGGLRYVREGVAEIKRIYSRPQFRGHGLGKKILEQLMADASRFGYNRVVLDSGPFMESAHKLYEQCGFEYCAPYPEVEVPTTLHSGWKFMSRVL